MRRRKKRRKKRKKERRSDACVRVVRGASAREEERPEDRRTGRCEQRGEEDVGHFDSRGFVV